MSDARLVLCCCQQGLIDFSFLKPSFPG